MPLVLALELSLGIHSGRLVTIKRPQTTSSQSGPYWVRILQTLCFVALHSLINPLHSEASNLRQFHSHPQFLDPQTLPHKQHNSTHTHNSSTPKPYLTSNTIPLTPKHHYTALNNQLISTTKCIFYLLHILVQY